MADWLIYIDYPPRLDIVLALVIWGGIFYAYGRQRLSIFRQAAFSASLAIVSAYLYNMWSIAGLISLDSLIKMILATYFGQIFLYYLGALALAWALNSLLASGSKKGIFRGR